MKLIGDPRVLSGHVESIAYGIEDQNRTTSGELLASVNPTFSWVRLAQRIPVRIKLDNVPPDLLLVAGRTATVSIGKISWWRPCVIAYCSAAPSQREMRQAGRP